MNDNTINAIGPLQERADRDPDVWNEIEHYGEYYYFRIGFHHYVSAEQVYVEQDCVYKD